MKGIITNNNADTTAARIWIMSCNIYTLDIYISMDPHTKGESFKI